LRVLIISDVHANLEALKALSENGDQLWVLGDLVNYGPDPAAVIELVRRMATVVVRGNHDHAVGFDEDPRCSPRFRRMAEETRRYTLSVLSQADRRFLRELPVTATCQIGGVRFHLSHALPSDPLYPYCGPDSERWVQEAERLETDVLLTGHTHLPFVREISGRLVVNPGSLGQAKHGRPEACYAVWEDGRIELHSVPYQVEDSVEKIRALPLSAEVREDLIAVLRGGRAPMSGFIP